MKDDLRREARDRLSELTAEERESAGEAAAARLWELPEMLRTRSILAYASLPDEVPTRSIVREARRRGIVVVYPRCLPEGRQMSLHRVARDEQLLPGGRYGLREPDPSCPLTRIQEIDCALVPGLGWDRKGHRLGRGAGYYDRLLATPDWTGLRCGLFFARQEFPALPTDPWDVRLHTIVTEQEVVRILNCEL